jgi:RNA polymerase sigma factor (sigma-70 family)
MHLNFRSLNDIELFELLSDEKNVNDAFFEIYSRYSRKILFFIKKMLNMDKSAEDIFQDVFIKVLESGKKKIEVENFNAYIFKIARNLTLNKIKQTKNLMIEYKDIFDLESESFSGFQNLENKELGELISSAIELLSDEYKEAFTLQTYFNMSYMEIADITKVPITTVRNRVVRAKVKLRQILSPYLEEEKN